MEPTPSTPTGLVNATPGTTSALDLLRHAVSTVESTPTISMDPVYATSGIPSALDPIGHASSSAHECASTGGSVFLRRRI